MPDNKKKKKVSTTPKQSAVTGAKKVNRAGYDNRASKGTVKKTVKKYHSGASKRARSQEKDGRMQAARDEQLKKDIKAAGGSSAYDKKIRKAKSGLIKYKDRYVRKSSAAGKKALAMRKKKK